jgi:NADH-quinone oxidoreductase subunit D
MFNRVGGLAADVPAGWTGRVRTRARRRARGAAGARAAADEVPRGVGVLARDVVLSHGVSGALARASGVDLDLRRDEPYLAYGSLDVRVRSAAKGTRTRASRASSSRWRPRSTSRTPAWTGCRPARSRCGCPRRSRRRRVDVRRGRRTHSASRATTWSAGRPTPWRLAMRTASFNNVSALGSALPGTRSRTVVTVLASFFFVIGDIDK